MAVQLNVLKSSLFQQFCFEKFLKSGKGPTPILFVGPWDSLRERCQNLVPFIRSAIYIRLSACCDGCGNSPCRGFSKVFIHAHRSLACKSRFYTPLLHGCHMPAACVCASLCPSPSRCRCVCVRACGQ
eukprot:1526222-Pleurochrysis_carterae.AAC.2